MVPAGASHRTAAGSFTARRQVVNRRRNFRGRTTPIAERRPPPVAAATGSPLCGSTRRRVATFLSCIALLGVSLIADFLWASSTAAVSPYFSVEKATGLLPPASKKVSRPSLTGVWPTTVLVAGGVIRHVWVEAKDMDLPENMRGSAQCLTAFRELLVLPMLLALPGA